MKSEKILLQQILRLDSIYNLLSSAERTNVRGKLLDWHWATLSESIQNLMQFLQANEVEIPVLKVGQDRLTYVVKPDELKPLDVYRQENKELQNGLIQIMRL